jgi:hypothetical protein
MFLHVYNIPHCFLHKLVLYIIKNLIEITGFKLKSVYSTLAHKNILLFH